jgi:hypothetical protein
LAYTRSGSPWGTASQHRRAPEECIAAAIKRS